MKLKDLFETPELRDREIDPIKAGWQDVKLDIMSYEAVERLYNKLETVDPVIIDGKEIVLYLNKKKLMCTAFIKNYNKDTNENTLRIINKIVFYYPRPHSNLPRGITNVLQVSNVYTDKEFEGQGLASLMYALLVKEGFTVVLDRVQYLGGQKLWRRMARRAHLNDYKINVWNEDNGYVKDEEGKILEYDNSNIEDSIIWKPTEIGRQTLLILSGK